MNVNVGVGQYSTGADWVDTDVICRPAENITPDMLASVTALPFACGTVARLYAGHCLEHLSLQDGPPSAFDRAMRETRRVLGPDGVAVFVCPDLDVVLEWWRDGKADRALLDACLEGPDDGIDPAAEWAGVWHAFNCTATRLLSLVQQTFPDAVTVPIESDLLDGWPLVSRAGWQVCVASKPLEARKAFG